MSFEPTVWAIKDAPTANTIEAIVLIGLAERAHVDGCGSLPSAATLARQAHLDTRTVKKCLATLEKRGLIARGDQSLAKYIRADRRPVVWDLMIPYTWWGVRIDRVNAERADKGLEPLTPENRPDIAEPAKDAKRKTRSDFGTKRKTTKGDSRSRGDSQSPRENGHGVTSSPARGDYQSRHGVTTRHPNQSFNPGPNPLQRDEPTDVTASDAETGAKSEEEENEKPKTKATPEALAFVSSLTGQAKIRGRKRDDLITDVAELLDAGWTVEALNDANEWPVKTPDLPHVVHPNWIKALKGQVPPASRMQAGNPLDDMPCPNPEHDGPITHDSRCERRYPDEVIDWKRVHLFGKKPLFAA